MWGLGHDSVSCFDRCRTSRHRRTQLGLRPLQKRLSSSAPRQDVKISIKLFSKNTYFYIFTRIDTFRKYLFLHFCWISDFFAATLHLKTHHNEHNKTSADNGRGEGSHPATVTWGCAPPVPRPVRQRYWGLLSPVGRDVPADDKRRKYAAAYDFFNPTLSEPWRAYVGIRQ